MHSGIKQPPRSLLSRQKVKPNQTERESLQ